MPINERICDVTRIRNWQDSIPLHYLYTTGIAGERFFKGIMQGKILASRCKRCKESFIPPRIYCVNCYSKIEEFVEVGGRGRVVAVAERRKGRKRIRYAFVRFEGIKGGIIHSIDDDVKVGDYVKPVFLPREKRKGDLSDITFFVKT